MCIAIVGTYIANSRMLIVKIGMHIVIVVMHIVIIGVDIIIIRKHVLCDGKENTIFGKLRVFKVIKFVEDVK